MSSSDDENADGDTSQNKPSRNKKKLSNADVMKILEAEVEAPSTKSYDDLIQKILDLIVKELDTTKTTAHPSDTILRQGCTCIKNARKNKAHREEIDNLEKKVQETQVQVTGMETRLSEMANMYTQVYNHLNLGPPRANT